MPIILRLYRLSPRWIRKILFSRLQYDPRIWALLLPNLRETARSAHSAGASVQATGGAHLAPNLPE